VQRLENKMGGEFKLRGRVRVTGKKWVYGSVISTG
jgi:hypothetical protein